MAGSTGGGQQVPVVWCSSGLGLCRGEEQRGEGQGRSREAEEDHEPILGDRGRHTCGGDAELGVRQAWGCRGRPGRNPQQRPAFPEPLLCPRPLIQANPRREGLRLPAKPPPHLLESWGPPLYVPCAPRACPHLDPGSGSS